MTSTIEHTAVEPEQIVYRDPCVLVVHPHNGRTDVGDLSDLTKSIAEVGVLQPIVLVPTEDGGEAILFGQRRTLAAIAAGKDVVPCIVRPDLAADIDAVTSAVSENLRRKALRPVEEARALYQQLAGFGLSATAIAKKTGSKPKQVKEGLVVAASELAVAAGERFAFLTFDHLSVLAEFAEDAEAVKELTVIAKEDPNYFDHRASQLRQAQIVQEKLAATTAKLAEAGVTIVEDPGYSERNPMRRLERCVNDKGRELTERAHAKCEGHVATLSPYDPERVTYWCLDPKRYGHQDRYASTSRTASSAERGTDGKLTEQARVERRRVIDNNRGMDAANPVRREFIVGLIARKAIPKGALRFVARDLAEHPSAMSGDDAFLAGFLASPVERSGYQRTTGTHAVDQASEGRLVHVLLAHSACAIESTWTKEAWRAVDTRKAAWLEFLAAQGYRLAEVEQLIVDEAIEKAEKRQAALDSSGDDDIEGVDEDESPEGEDFDDQN